jgi:hypothetical protein
MIEVQLEVNDARAIREAIGHAALGEQAGLEVARTAAYDVSAANAAGATSHSFDGYIREPKDLQTKAVEGGDKDGSVVMIVDQLGIHVKTVTKSGGGAAEVGAVLVEYMWDTVSEVLAVKPSDDPQDMELLLIEISTEEEVRVT